MTRKQPRARIGQGGYSPALGDKDPRNRRSQQPQVAGSKRIQRALDRAGEVTAESTDLEVRATLAAVLDALRGGA